MEPSTQPREIESLQGAAPAGSPPPRPVALLVLGMHRSGTSATTRVLSLLGAATGPYKVVCTPHNQRGNWENLRMRMMNDDLLGKLGRTWHDPRPMPPEWRRQPCYAEALSSLCAAIREDFADAPLWVVKDPRMCRLLPLWRDAFDALDIDARVLLVARRPSEVMASIRARNGDACANLACWKRHILEALHGSRDLPRAMITYDGLLRDPDRVARHVGACLGIRWPADPDDARMKIREFLEASLRHHDHRPVATDDGGDEDTGAIYEACERAAAGDADGWKRLEGFVSKHVESHDA